LHSATGQAKVRINGVDHYLGKYGSPASREQYDSLILEWFSTSDVKASTLTVDDLSLRYAKFAEGYYVKNGEPTSEVHCVKNTLSRIVVSFGNSLAKQFGPKKLNVIREQMVVEGIVRKSINRNIGRIRRMFKWAVAEELLPVEVYQALCTLPGLRYGRSDAKESDPVLPVSETFVNAVQPFVSRQIWAMIQLQLLTGARPGEIVQMKACNVSMSGKAWEYVPPSHKLQHHERQRVIFLGPRAQCVVREFLKPDLNAFLFSPKDAQSERFALRRENRKTPMTPSQLARKPKAKSARQPGESYTVESYGKAISAACKKANREAHAEHPEISADVEIVPHWHPNQLRHNSGTDLRRRFDLEACRTVLGHSTTTTTEIYAEKDRAKAREIMSQIG
jgi:site-specific recombinase XerD